MTVRFGASFDEVLAAAQAGAGWAFERLYRWIAPGVLSYARGQGVVDPEDVTSDVFMQVFHSIANFEGDEDRFRSWVFTVAHHAMVDRRRRASRRPLTETMNVLDAEPVAVADVEAAALAAVGEQRLREILDLLPADQRDVLLLRVLADLSIEETAEAFGRSPGAIKQLQRRAAASLRRIISGMAVTL